MVDLTGTDIGDRATSGPQEPLDEKTNAALLPMFLDFYRQEVAAEEDVHRTLPFFATALGLIVAALNYVAGQLPDWAAARSACAPGETKVLSWGFALCAWPFVLAAALLIGSVGLALAVLGLLVWATNRREYKRIGPEAAHIGRAMALRDYHAQLGLAGDDLDRAVSRDLRHQLLADLAAVIPVNRDLTLQRYKWRARAVVCLLLGLLCALVATIVMTTMKKSGFIA